MAEQVLDKIRDVAEGQIVSLIGPLTSPSLLFFSFIYSYFLFWPYVPANIRV